MTEAEKIVELKAANDMLCKELAELKIRLDEARKAHREPLVCPQIWRQPDTDPHPPWEPIQHGAGHYKG